MRIHSIGSLGKRKIVLTTTDRDRRRSSLGPEESGDPVQWAQGPSGKAHVRIRSVETKQLRRLLRREAARRNRGHLTGLCGQTANEDSGRSTAQRRCLETRERVCNSAKTDGRGVHYWRQPVTAQVTLYIYTVYILLLKSMGMSGTQAVAEPDSAGVQSWGYRCAVASSIALQNGERESPETGSQNDDCPQAQQNTIELLKI